MFNGALLSVNFVELHILVFYLIKDILILIKIGFLPLILKHLRKDI